MVVLPVVPVVAEVMLVVLSVQPDGTNGLVCKNGYAVAYWDETKQTEEEEYDDLSDDAFALIANDPEVEIVEHEQEPDESLNAYNMQAYQMAVGDVRKHGHRSRWGASGMAQRPG